MNRDKIGHRHAVIHQHTYWYMYIGYSEAVVGVPEGIKEAVCVRG